MEVFDESMLKSSQKNPKRESGRQFTRVRKLGIPTYVSIPFLEKISINKTLMGALSLLKNNSLINRETVYITGEFDKDGQLCSRIIRGYTSFRVKKSPLKLMDASLKNFGSSLRGALDGSKEILGKKNMRPLVLNAYSGIYLFPSKSPSKPDCVWFSLLHVLNTESISRNETKVFLSYGHTIVIEMNESNFNRRLNRALELRRIVSENMKIPITFYLDPKYHSRIILSRGKMIKK